MSPDMRTARMRENVLIQVDGVRGDMLFLAVGADERGIGCREASVVQRSPKSLHLLLFLLAALSVRLLALREIAPAVDAGVA
jgi:hypothetical protein